MLCLPPALLPGAFSVLLPEGAPFWAHKKRGCFGAAPFCFMLWFSDSTLENKPVTRIA